MEYKIKYLFDAPIDVDTIPKLAQFLSMYSSIYFSEDGSKVKLVEENLEETINNTEIKKVNSEYGNFYTITVVVNEDISLLEMFDKLIFKIINVRRDYKDGHTFIILQDGISQFYSSKAYPKLNYIENLIRAFITEMMSFFAGPNWAKEQGKKLISFDPDSYENNLLYKSNFNELNNVLTKTYREKEAVESLNDFYRELQNTDKENFEAFKMNFLKNKPKTLWDSFVKEYTSTSWEHEQFKNKMKDLYGLRNKIAHANKFRKQEYLVFNEKVSEMEEEITKLISEIEQIDINNIDNETRALINIASDEVGSEDITKDVLLVPAKENGFEQVFLGENQWYHVKISEEKLNQLKYIAAYEIRPKQFIRYYAEIESITDSESKEGYKTIKFKNGAKLLPNNRKIILGNNPYYAPQSTRYVSSEKLFDESIETLEQLFN